jgi:predicted SAM-dependent methyltransferase
MDLRELVKLGLDREINCFEEFSGDQLLRLNVGSGNKKIPGTIDLDLPEWDADSDPIPFREGSVSEIHCYHFLEHVKFPVRVLLEFQRVLCSGGIVNIGVPYYTSQMQHHDLDHKNNFCEMTWKTLFQNPYYDKNKIEWKFQIVSNFIFGIVERNLFLFTQLRKR